MCFNLHVGRVDEFSDGLQKGLVKFYDVLGNFYHTKNEIKPKQNRVTVSM